MWNKRLEISYNKRTERCVFHNVWCCLNGKSIICRWTTTYRSKAYSLMYIPFMCRKPAARHQNKISSRTNAKVPHLLEWKMVWSIDSVAFTCKGFYFLCNVNNKAQGWFWSTSTEDKSSYMNQNFSEETWILPRHKCGNLMISPLIYMIMQMQMPPEDDTDNKRKTRGQITGIEVIEYLFYMVTRMCIINVWNYQLTVQVTL